MHHREFASVGGVVEPESKDRVGLPPFGSPSLHDGLVGLDEQIGAAKVTLVCRPFFTDLLAHRCLGTGGIAMLLAVHVDAVDLFGAGALELYELGNCLAHWVLLSCGARWRAFGEGDSSNPAQLCSPLSRTFRQSLPRFEIW